MEICNTEEMNEHFLKCFPEEGCGFVLPSKIQQGLVFFPMENIAEERRMDFKIHSDEYLKYSDRLQGVIHSHTFQDRYDTRRPSMRDMIGQKNTAVPWGIVACDGENVTKPIWFGTEEPAPLQDRPYIPGVYDCLTLACDYMWFEFGIKVPMFPRPPEWDDYNKNFIVDGIDEGGFRKLPKDTKLKDLKKGDFILFKVQGNYVNHVGVYDGDGHFWHQLRGRLPTRESIHRWKRTVAMYLRHKTL